MSNNLIEDSQYNDTEFSGEKIQKLLLNPNTNEMDVEILHSKNEEPIWYHIMELSKNYIIKLLTDFKSQNINRYNNIKDRLMQLKSLNLMEYPQENQADIKQNIESFETTKTDLNSQLKFIETTQCDQKKRKEIDEKNMYTPKKSNTTNKISDFKNDLLSNPKILSQNQKTQNTPNEDTQIDTLETTKNNVAAKYDEKLASLVKIEHEEDSSTNFTVKKNDLKNIIIKVDDDQFEEQCSDDNQSQGRGKNGTFTNFLKSDNGCMSDRKLRKILIVRQERFKCREESYSFCRKLRFFEEN